ncbi:hypothetical protein [Streptomyces violaceorubidus]|uniref:Uncharacterized protein n=1 Tax=Streptomyces violaceorubidus TaxID=284042 RepID=A0ABV1T155_9ACTN
MDSRTRRFAAADHGEPVLRVSRRGWAERRDSMYEEALAAPGEWGTAALAEAAGHPLKRDASAGK